jgi:hypothetical protein
MALTLEQIRKDNPNWSLRNPGHPGLEFSIRAKVAAGKPAYYNFTSTDGGKTYSYATSNRPFKPPANMPMEQKAKEYAAGTYGDFSGGSIDGVDAEDPALALARTIWNKPPVVPPPAGGGDPEGQGQRPPAAPPTAVAPAQQTAALPTAPPTTVAPAPAAQPAAHTNNKIFQFIQKIALGNNGQGWISDRNIRTAKYQLMKNGISDEVAEAAIQDFLNYYGNQGRYVRQPTNVSFGTTGGSNIRGPGAAKKAAKQEATRTGLQAAAAEYTTAPETPTVPETPVAPETVAPGTAPVILEDRIPQELEIARQVAKTQFDSSNVLPRKETASDGTVNIVTHVDGVRYVWEPTKKVFVEAPAPETPPQMYKGGYVRRPKKSVVAALTQWKYGQ